MPFKRTTQPASQAVLIILDGWGEAPAWGGNAPTSARLPTMNDLYRTSFHTTLEASGNAVGLPGHEQGNSEVGHLTIGAGRPIVQDRTKISNAIDDGSFFRNAILLGAMDRVANTGTLHLIGLVSDGGVHSHIDHLHALLELASQRHVARVAIHAITDGRDTPPQSAGVYLDRIRHWCETLNVGAITSMVGRYFAMDRDNHWDRIQSAYNLIARGVGEHATSPLAALSAAYQKGKNDEFLPPVWIDTGLSPIQSGDSVIFFNFRQDRARELLTALANSAFREFPRPTFTGLSVATMIPYWFDEKDPAVIPIFNPDTVDHSLGGTIAEAGLKQLRVAETEKYAHITYFLNGGTEKPFAGEDRQLIPSKLVTSPADHPAMKTLDIAQAVVSAIRAKKYAAIMANIAAPDMVGHTGSFAAAVSACEETGRRV